MSKIRLQFLFLYLLQGERNEVKEVRLGNTFDVALKAASFVDRTLLIKDFFHLHVHSNHVCLFKNSIIMGKLNKM